MKKRFLHMLLPFAFMGAMASQAEACPNSKLDHVAVLVDNTDDVVRSLRTAFSAQQFGEVMQMTDESFGTLKLTYVSLGGFWLELVEPVGLGPMRDHINEIGSGTIIELNFETENLLQCSQWLAARKIGMTDVDGNLYSSGTPGTIIEQYGIRFAYVDKAQTNGLSVEYYQRGAIQPDILTRRDMWQQKILKSNDLELSSVDVQISNLQKTMDVFSKLGFSTSKEEASCREGACHSALVKTSGPYIRLYEPSSCEKAECDGSRVASDVISSVTVSVSNSVYNELQRAKSSRLPGLQIIVDKNSVDTSNEESFGMPKLKVRVEAK